MAKFLFLPDGEDPDTYVGNSDQKRLKLNLKKPWFYRVFLPTS